MLDNLQRDFAAKVYAADKHEHFVQSLNEYLGMTIEYRICEMPVFVSNSFKAKLEEASRAIVEECVQPEYLANTAPALQDRYNVPKQHPRPLFATVDFAVTQDPSTGEYEPKLIEMQGFPSLFGYQYVYSMMVMKWYDLERQLGTKLDYVLSGKTDKEYLELMKRVLLAGHHPDNVALLEYKPEIQKTRPDFLCTEKLTGIQATDICSVKKRVRNSSMNAAANGCQFTASTTALSWMNWTKTTFTFLSVGTTTLMWNGLGIRIGIF